MAPSTALGSDAPEAPTRSPPKTENLRTLPLDRIEKYVRQFLAYAEANPALLFKVTAIGTGLAGYRHEDIAPMFARAPANCRLPPEWHPSGLKNRSPEIRARP